MTGIFKLPARLTAGTILLIAGCSTGAANVTEAPVPPTKPAEPVSVTPVTPEAPQSFEAWRTGFRARALAEGISPAVFDRALLGVTPNPKVLELDAFQPEFTRPIWEYLASAASETRVANGRTKLARHAADLQQIEARFGVDRHIVVAVWGLESAYGGNFGSLSVIRSLATLAHTGRRRAFGEEQLLAALRIIQSGDISADRMVGSWAGAMGHTQFIPTSYLSYAVDWTGDGRRDVWADNPSDALASTANYLARFGWQTGAPVVLEVVLPAGFDVLLADETARSGAQWSASGLRTASGGALPADPAKLILPAGASGPAFLTYRNFDVIKRYNNATSYALAVALLAQRIEGSGGYVVAAWPTDDRPLSRTEKVELQTSLTALGYDTKGVDGIIGPNSRAAVRAFQRDRGIVPDGYVSAQLLEAVRAARP